MNENSKNPFSNLPSCAADYIRLVIKKIRWQKKARADVQAELIGHFEDALKDCKTNEDKEKTARELISNFGDAKLIATLARRAKKHCRPLWQKTFIKAFQTSGIIIVLFILYVIWFLSGKPKITVNYIAELNRIVKPVAADDSQNAAVYYDEAAKKIETLPENLKNIFAKSYYECNEPEKKQGQDWLAKNQEVLNLVIAGSDKPYCWDKYESKNNDTMSVLLPHLKEYRNIARILCWKACFSASGGNYRQGFENIITTYKLGKHIKTEPILIEQLVGIAIENLSAQNLRQILSKYNIDALELRNLQDELSAITQNETFRMNFKAERMCGYDAIQRTFTDDVFGGHLYLKEFGKLMGEVSGANSTQEQIFWASSELLHALFIQPGKNETLKATAEIYDYYDKLSVMTPFEQRSANINEKIQELANKNMLLAMFCPGFDKIAGLAYRNKAEIQAATIIIAIIRRKQENGTYPDKLEQLLDKGLLKEIPLDPYSDKPLVYKKSENGFTLYSVGSDFVDNGGKMGVDKKGKPNLWDIDGSDAVFWPVAHPKK
ncbi:MAG: hypothetical protein WCE45_10075 [Sedimentisphaerales bacterium]